MRAQSPFLCQALGRLLRQRASQAKSSSRPSNRRRWPFANEPWQFWRVNPDTLHISRHTDATAWFPCQFRVLSIKVVAACANSLCSCTIWLRLCRLGCEEAHSPAFPLPSARAASSAAGHVRQRLVPPSTSATLGDGKGMEAKDWVPESPGL